MKKQFMLAAAGALLTIGTANAIAGESSGSVAVTSDYRFRGISQTDNDPAVQGTLEYALESGFYANFFGSNVDNFSPNPVTGDNGAQAEFDLGAGYGFALNDQWALDFNVLYFYYPGASTAGNQPEIDYFEYTPGISYSGDTFSASFSAPLSDDFFGESGFSYYPNITFDFPLEDYLSLGVHVGYQGIDDNAAFGTPDYTDWSVSLSTSQFGFDWSVAYVDTNIDDHSECFGGSNTCDPAAVFTLSKSF